MPRVGQGLFALLAAAFAASAQSATYNLQTIAGGNYAGDGGPALSAVLKHLEGVATDSWGNVYIADADDHRVRKIAVTGIISTVAGNGHPGFSGDGGPAAAAQLRTPYGVAADRYGNLYVADLGNARIRRIGADGKITTYAGGGSQELVNNASATTVALTSPRNVAVDDSGTLFFSDFGGNRVLQVSTSGVLTIVAGTGLAGFSGDGGAARLAQLSGPAGLAVDRLGALYIADSGNARIRKVDRGTISTLGDGGKAGAASTVPVSLPVGVALDTDGSLYIADVGGNQILRVTTGMTFQPIAQPARDVAVDAAGTLYACTEGKLYRRNRLGGGVLVAGGASTAMIGDGGPALEARFNHPNGVAHDAIGNLYIADTGNHRIRKVSLDGTVSTIAGTGVQGYSGDGGLATQAKLDTPIGLALDGKGNLYFADSGNQRIRMIDPAGVLWTAVGTGVKSHSQDGTLARYAQLDTPAWVSFGGDGTLYFSEIGNHAVRRVDALGEVRTVAGSGVRGYSGDGGPAALAALDSPQGIAVDAAGNVYIADAGNQRIRMVSPGGSNGVSTITTIPDVGTSNWGSVRGLAVDARGNLYLTDALAAQAFRIDPPGAIYAIAGTSTTAFTGESGPALQQALDTPAGITLDSAGNVYLTDSGNGRIRMLQLASSVTPVNPAGSGQPALTVVNAASLQPGAVAPGELVTLFGASLGPADGVTASAPTVDLGGVQVTFNGRLAPMTYAGGSQINAQVPYSLGDARPCEVQVLSNGVVKARAQLNVTDAAPGIFTTANGAGQAAALNDNGSLNTTDNPAARGSIIVLFATGEGQTTPAGVEGRPAGSPAPLPVLPVLVSIGDYAAEVTYAGAAPGFAGLLQVNARVPGGFAPPGVLPVTIVVGTAASQAGVTVAVR